MIQLVTGPNRYESRRLRRQAIEDYRAEKGAESVAVVDGTSVTVDELPQQLMGVSLFAPRRLVVIDDADAQKAVWDKLADLLEQVDGDSDIMLVAPTADKRTRTYKWAQKNARVVTTQELSDGQLLSWLQNLARDEGLELRSETARYIIDFTAGDQWQLENDVRKLSLSGAPITNELITDLLVANPQASAFDLLDAALAARVDDVDRLLRGVRSNEDPYRFFGLLSNQIFAVVVIAAAGNRPPDTIAKDTGLHPFVVKKTQPLARRLSAARRNRLVGIAATTDMQLKSSGVEPWTLLTAALKSIAAG